MKYIRTYENIDNPKVGDYVICKDITSSDEVSKNFQKFLDENIGQIVSGDDINLFIVLFDKLPSEEILEYAFYTLEHSHVKKLIQLPNIKVHKSETLLYTNLCGFEKKEIVFFSDNREDLEIKISANKFNI